MGCPAPKVVKNGDGSCLLLDLEKAVSVAKACVNATQKPITVKLRSGYFKNKFVAVELAKKLESVGVCAITIHGRTKEDMYSGTVNYDIIKAVKEAVKIPVIGNGDIVDAESYQKMLKTGVDAVMIGRGALGAPWIFKQLLGKKLSEQEKFEAIKKHISLLQELYDEKFLTTYLRKHFLWYVKGKAGISQKKVALAKTTSLDDALKILQEVFNA
jgi:nifR3 family TIM-barrel protein